jgi:hypothetical protein
MEHGLAYSRNNNNNNNNKRIGNQLMFNQIETFVFSLKKNATRM